MASAYSISPVKSTIGGGDANLQKKIEYLTQEMKAIDVNHDQFISREELYNYLDKKSGKEEGFDKNIANEIFDHMDKNHDGSITIDEFIKVYVEADEILRRKIETAKQNKDYYRRQYDESIKKSEEARLTERLSAAGIMEQSFANVTVVSARDLPSGFTGVVDPFVEVSLDRTQTLKTKVINDNPNPSWNEKFLFEVNSVNSQLKFTVLDYGGMTRGGFVGDVTVPVRDLGDQTIHEVWLDIFDKVGNKVQGQLNVKLHWVHSKVKYYALAAEKWREAFEKENLELKEYQDYLKNLWDPFSGMAQFKNTYENPRGSVKSDAGLGGFEKKMHSTMHAMASKFMPDPANENMWLRIATYTCLITLVLSLLMSFARPPFLDILYSLCVIMHIQRDMFRELLNWGKLSFMIILSFLLLDLPFLMIYPGKWNKQTWLIDGNLLSHVRTFVDVVTYISVVVKLIQALIFYAIHIQQKKAANPRVSLRKMNLANA